jgi:N,N'-diacetyllegionaminate synthase
MVARPTFIIAEAGVNHNGDANLALQLVDIAADSGADAVKFQTFTADRLVRRGADKAEYQKRMTGDGDQYDMLKSLEMSEALHRRLVEHCAARGIEFMSTAFDEQALDMLVELGIRRIKVPSGELTNEPFLRAMAAKGLPLVVSTGMATLEEVKAAVATIDLAAREAGHGLPLEQQVTILHCTSNYPADASEANLNAMLTLGRETGLAYGYSDHTLGIAVSTAAVALGAVVIEKHFTISKTMVGPDHSASLEPDELATMVKAIRVVESAMGDGVKAPTPSELAVRALVRRSVTATRPIAAGEIIDPEAVTLMRPGTGIPPSELTGVHGRRAARAIETGETLTWEHVA